MRYLFSCVRVCVMMSTKYENIKKNLGRCHKKLSTGCHVRYVQYYTLNVSMAVYTSLLRRNQSFVYVVGRFCDSHRVHLPVPKLNCNLKYGTKVHQHRYRNDKARPCSTQPTFFYKIAARTTPIELYFLIEVSKLQ